MEGMTIKEMLNELTAAVSSAVATAVVSVVAVESFKQGLIHAAGGGIGLPNNMAALPLPALPAPEVNMHISFILRDESPHELTSSMDSLARSSQERSGRRGTRTRQRRGKRCALLLATCAIAVCCGRLLRPPEYCNTRAA